MTPEKQQIAIAEACGWTGKEEDYIFHGFTRDIPMTRIRWTHPDESKPTLNLPDYLNDLNAMHEAEKVLYRDSKLSVKYVLIIGETMQLPAALWSNERTKFVLMHATAAQRAEAFLRTIGKWEDGK